MVTTGPRSETGTRSATGRASRTSCRPASGTGSDGRAPSGTGAEWDRFCAAYGVNPGELPGLAVLREMREVRTLVPYIRSAGHPAAQAEVRKRIDDLMTCTQREPWRALNLDS